MKQKIGNKNYKEGFMKQRILVIVLAVLVALGCASGWVYHFVVNKNTYVIQPDEYMGLQVSFMKKYGNDATIKEAISPKIYEVSWTDAQGNSNVSMCVGGVWILIASQKTMSPSP